MKQNAALWNTRPIGVVVPEVLITTPNGSAATKNTPTCLLLPLLLLPVLLLLPHDCHGMIAARLSVQPKQQGDVPFVLFPSQQRIIKLDNKSATGGPRYHHHPLRLRDTMKGGKSSLTIMRSSLSSKDNNDDEDDSDENLSSVVQNSIEENSSTTPEGIGSSSSSASSTTTMGMMKEIIALGLPSLGSCLVDPVMSLVDTACVGQVSTLQLASLAPCTSIYQFLFFSFFFLSIGTTTFVAANNPRTSPRELSAFEVEGNSYAEIVLLSDGNGNKQQQQESSSKSVVINGGGASSSSSSSSSNNDTGMENANNANHDNDIKAEQIVSSTSYLALLLGTMISLILLFCTDSILAVAGCNTEMLLVPARKYLRIRSIGLPAVFFSMVLQGASLGRQDPVTPLRVFSLAGLMNLVGDLLLTLGFGWGVTGAAIATTTSQLFAAGYFAAVMMRRRPREQQQQRQRQEQQQRRRHQSSRRKWLWKRKSPNNNNNNNNNNGRQPETKKQRYYKNIKHKLSSFLSILTSLLSSLSSLSSLLSSSTTSTSMTKNGNNNNIENYPLAKKNLMIAEEGEGEEEERKRYTLAVEEEPVVPPSTTTTKLPPPSTKKHQQYPQQVALVWSRGLPEKSIILSFGTMALTLMFGSIVDMMSYSLMTRAAAGLGTVALAAHLVTLQVSWLFSFVAETIGMPLQSLIARDYNRYLSLLSSSSSPLSSSSSSSLSSSFIEKKGGDNDSNHITNKMVDDDDAETSRRCSNSSGSSGISSDEQQSKRQEQHQEQHSNNSRNSSSSDDDNNSSNIIIDDDNNNDSSNTTTTASTAATIRMLHHRVRKLILVGYLLTLLVGTVIAVLTGLCFHSSVITNRIVQDKTVQRLLIQTAPHAMLGQILSPLCYNTDSICFGLNDIKSLPFQTILATMALFLGLRSSSSSNSNNIARTINNSHNNNSGERNIGAFFYKLLGNKKSGGVESIWMWLNVFFIVRLLCHSIFSQKIKEVLFFSSSNHNNDDD